MLLKPTQYYKLQLVVSISYNSSYFSVDYKQNGQTKMCTLYPEICAVWTIRRLKKQTFLWANCWAPLVTMNSVRSVLMALNICSRVSNLYTYDYLVVLALLVLLKWNEMSQTKSILSCPDASMAHWSCTFAMPGQNLHPSPGRLHWCHCLLKMSVEKCLPKWAWKLLLSCFDGHIFE